MHDVVFDDAIFLKNWLSEIICILITCQIHCIYVLCII